MLTGGLGTPGGGGADEEALSAELGAAHRRRARPRLRLGPPMSAPGGVNPPRGDKGKVSADPGGAPSAGGRLDEAAACLEGSMGAGKKGTGGMAGRPPVGSRTGTPTRPSGRTTAVESAIAPPTSTPIFVASINRTDVRKRKLIGSATCVGNGVRGRRGRGNDRKRG